MHASKILVIFTSSNNSNMKKEKLIYSELTINEKINFKQNILVWNSPKRWDGISTWIRKYAWSDDGFCESFFDFMRFEFSGYDRKKHIDISGFNSFIGVLNDIPRHF